MAGGAADLFHLEQDRVGITIDEHLADFLKMAAQAGFHGPISLHLEFQTPGVSDGQGIALSRDTVDKVMALAKEDLTSLKALLRAAYQGV